MITECKCSTTVDALLDVEKDQVICQSCGEVIENISSFMKTTMKQNGHIVRNNNAARIPKGGMLVECNATVNGKFCGNKFPALLEKKDEECYCPKCHTKVALAGFAKALLRENGQYVGMVNLEDEKMNLDEEEEHNGPVVFNDKIENDNKKTMKVPAATTVKTIEAVQKKLNAQEPKVEVAKKKRGRPPKVK
jgi:hypothetical protein